MLFNLYFWFKGNKGWIGVSETEFCISSVIWSNDDHFSNREIILQSVLLLMSVWDRIPRNQSAEWLFGVEMGCFSINYGSGHSPFCIWAFLYFTFSAPFLSLPFTSSFVFLEPSPPPVKFLAIKNVSFKVVPCWVIWKVILVWHLLGTQAWKGLSWSQEIASISGGYLLPVRSRYKRPSMRVTNAGGCFVLIFRCFLLFLWVQKKLHDSTVALM